MSHKASRIEVILKVVERCNINCSYCYYFNMGNDDSKQRPVYVDATTLLAVTDFFRAAIKEFGAHELAISIHGGEPLMLKKQAFDDMCGGFRKSLSSMCTLVLALQTNGMLIDEEWIDLFQRHGIHVGVSIDGPRQYHDRFRVDHQGHGTHNRAVAGFRKLQAAANDGRIATPGVLAVLDPSIPSDGLYRYLIDELGVKLIDILLPHTTHDVADPTTLAAVERSLTRMFQLWLQDDDPTINVRLFKNLMSRLGRSPGYLEGRDNYPHGTIAFTIFSDGTLACDDTMHSLGKEFSGTGMNVRDTSPSQFLASPIMTEVISASLRMPKGCQDCEWQNVCHGGSVHERFSKAQRFDNKTAYCDSMDSLLQNIARYLVANGLPVERLAETLSASYVTI